MKKHKPSYEGIHVHTWLVEALDFIVIFFGVFVMGMGLFNYKVFMIEFQEMFGVEGKNIERTYPLQQEFTIQTVNPLIGAEIETGKNSLLFEYNLEEYLENKISDYPLVFNTLVPGKRLVIDSIGVDAPIVDVKAASQQKLVEGLFDEELKNGVVKYPFTTPPGEIGNTLLFGHSSVDSWKAKNNKRGYVFYRLPKMIDGDLITLYWDGQLYEYEVDKKVITWPSKVAEEVSAYNDSRYLTLMACYPLLSDAKRILVRARQRTSISSDQQSNLLALK